MSSTIIEKSELEILKEKMEEKRKKQCIATKKLYDKKFKNCNEEEKKKNTENRKKYQNSYYAKNKEKIQERQRRYRKERKEKKEAEKENNKLKSSL